jgi:hypothetical protein
MNHRRTVIARGVAFNITRTQSDHAQVAPHLARVHFMDLPRCISHVLMYCICPRLAYHLF